MCWQKFIAAWSSIQCKVSINCPESLSETSLSQACARRKTNCNSCVSCGGLPTLTNGEGRCCILFTRLNSLVRSSINTAVFGHAFTARRRVQTISRRPPCARLNRCHDKLKFNRTLRHDCSATIVEGTRFCLHCHCHCSQHKPQPTKSTLQRHKDTRHPAQGLVTESDSTYFQVPRHEYGAPLDRNQIFLM